MTDSNTQVKKKINLQKHEYYRGRLEQVVIYLGKFFRMFVYQSDWKVLPMAAIIAGIVTMVVGQYIYVTQEGTLTGCFAIVCVCIWNGFFNSIQVVCRERGIVKREHRAGLHMSSYVAAHMIYQMFLCASQTAITIGVCYLVGMKFPEESLVTPWFTLDLAITIFLITYSSDILALMISCLVRNTTAAMTVMPFMLIIQMIFSGGYVELRGAAEKVTNFMISKWGLDSMCTIGNYNKLGMVTLWNTIFKFKDMEVDGQKPILEVIKKIEQENMVGEVTRVSGEYNQNINFLFEPNTVLRAWAFMALSIIVFGLLAVILLEFIDRDKR